MRGVVLRCLLPFLSSVSRSYSSLYLSFPPLLIRSDASLLITGTHRQRQSEMKEKK